MRTRTVVPSVLIVASLLLAATSLVGGRSGAAVKYTGLAVALALALTVAHLEALRAGNLDLVLATLACVAATVGLAVGFTRGLQQGHTSEGRMFLLAVGAVCCSVPAGLGIWFLFTGAEPNRRQDE